MELSTFSVDNLSTFYPQKQVYIAAQYIGAICVTGLSTGDVDKFSTFYPQRRSDVAAQYIGAICVTDLSTFCVDKFSTLSTFFYDDMTIIYS